METPSDLTWEDVFAVCKLMGVDYSDEYDEGYTFWRPSAFPSTFTNPTDALEFISAEEHELEKKYANILRTKP